MLRAQPCCRAEVGILDLNDGERLPFRLSRVPRVYGEDGTCSSELGEHALAAPAW